MIGLHLFYAANIVVAGWISISCMFYPIKAVSTVFYNAFAYSDAIRLVGALWAGIFVLSVLGMFFPKKMVPVLLFQLIYKGLWLVVVAIPAIIGKKEYPEGMAVFFVIWCLLLPFVIPWKDIFL